MQRNYSRISLVWVTIATLVLIVACSSGDGTAPAPQSASSSAAFRITVTNATNNQPLSPMAVIVHNSNYTVWDIGSAVTQPFEMLAEGGDFNGLLNDAAQNVDVFNTASGSGVVLPGASDSIDISVTSSGSIRLSVATMLVNTNDAFSGVNNISIDDLAVGQAATYVAPAYDAGTEANTEDAASIPGPAAGGEGFNAARNDTDFVSVHPGVISSQDGMTGSVLDGSYRWDNPVLTLTVTRTG